MNKGYSLVRDAWVDTSEASALMTETDITPEEFHDGCVNLFPIVTGIMDPTEVHAMRSITGWQPDPQGTTTEVSGMEGRMRRALVLPAGLPEHLRSAQIIPTDLLPPKIDDVPLLSRWQVMGQMMFDDNRFFYYRPDVLRRDAYPAGDVVGRGGHGDATFDEGFKGRYMSAFHIIGSKSIMPPPSYDPVANCPTWSTGWYDQRDISHDYFMEKIDRKFRLISVQEDIHLRCPQRPMPVGVDVLTPTWMLHIAGGILDHPDHMVVDPETGQIAKAHVGHAIMVCPPASAAKVRTLEAA